MCRIPVTDCERQNGILTGTIMLVTMVVVVLSYFLVLQQLYEIWPMLTDLNSMLTVSSFPPVLISASMGSCGFLVMGGSVTLVSSSLWKSCGGLGGGGGGGGRITLLGVSGVVPGNRG